MLFYVVFKLLTSLESKKIFKKKKKKGKKDGKEERNKLKIVPLKKSEWDGGVEAKEKDADDDEDDEINELIQ